MRGAGSVCGVSKLYPSFSTPPKEEKEEKEKEKNNRSPGQKADFFMSIINTPSHYEIVTGTQSLVWLPCFLNTKKKMFDSLLDLRCYSRVSAPLDTGVPL